MIPSMAETTSNTLFPEEYDYSFGQKERGEYF